jgi:hypothetical protein
LLNYKPVVYGDVGNRKQDGKKKVLEEGTG